MSSVLIGGGSGLIGSRLSQVLTEAGYEVAHLSRSASSDAIYPTYTWDINKQEIDDEAIVKADYVINLAGAGIADKPWTKSRKEIIIESRVQSTQLLLDAFTRTGHQPKAFISSSAIGYYGDRGEEVLTESHSSGSGFLSVSTKAWEESIQKIADSGIRTVGVRTGVVLSTKGGAMEKMLLPLKMRMATYFGNGRQWYSWIHIDDICGIYQFLMEKENASGFYNGVAPNPVRNKQLTAIMKEAYGKPALMLPAPALAMQLFMGEMAHVVLDSTRVSAEKIQNEGYHFEFEELKPALDHLLAKQI